MNTIASRDQFQLIRIGENLVLNYNELRPIYGLRFVVPICRPREIVKQIGAFKWRPDARAISVRHVDRFGKNLWSLHRFSRVRADFTAQAYVSLRKMADVESKLARKKRSFDEKEINLLISQWSECPCLFDKTNPDHKDQNKRADLLHNFSGPTNRHDKSQRVNMPL